MNKILFGNTLDSLRTLPDGIVQTCVTSPPYFGLRSYLPDDHPDKVKEIGAEKTPDEFIANLVAVFREVRRVLKDDGTLWVNIGDSYAGGGGGNYTKGIRNVAGGQNVTNVRNQPEWLGATGLKSKDLIGIPWLLAFALRADGWYLRQDIIWHKPNPMPESVTDRCTKAHEYVFLLSKGPRYYFDSESMKEPAVQAGRVRNDRMGGNKYVEGVKHSDGAMFTGSETRNRRSVWTVATRPYKGAHFAVFPPALIEPCILAGSAPGDVVLDPFMGSGTTAQVALEQGRQYLGCEIDERCRVLQYARIDSVLAGQFE